MNNDFLDISYLANGNPRQRHCYRVLTGTCVIDFLAPWNPVVAGTIPIGIDIPSSDADIICEAYDTVPFGGKLREFFGMRKHFTLRCRDNGAIVCGFTEDRLDIEIYAAPQPPVESDAYRHMIVEKRILDLLGPAFRNRVLDLKLRGMKTESVFAWLLGLNGNPYHAILELEAYSDSRLAELFLR